MPERVVRTSLVEGMSHGVAELAVAVVVGTALAEAAAWLAVQADVASCESSYYCQRLPWRAWRVTVRRAEMMPGYSRCHWRQQWDAVTETWGAK